MDVSQIYKIPSEANINEELYKIPSKIPNFIEVSFKKFLTLLRSLLSVFREVFGYYG